MNSQELEQAARDLSLIRQSIHAVERMKKKRLPWSAYQAQLYILSVSFVLCSIFIGLEIFGNQYITHEWERLKVDPEGRISKILIIGGFLLICLLNVYFVVWQAALRSKESFDAYIERNFRYLKNISHVSDLFLKFVVIAAVVAVGRPEWSAPFLLLFTGDYLMSGRLFVLPFRASVGIALICYLMGVVQFISGQYEVLWPLFTFNIITLLSILRLRRLRKVRDE